MEQKEQNKNPTASPNGAKPKTPLTEQQRQKRRKMLVYPLMGLLFIGSMWLIFAPSEKDKAAEQQGVGFNTEMPLPAESGIIADKRAAYEQARMEEKQNERKKSMQDLASMFTTEKEEATEGDDFNLLNPEPEAKAASSYGGGGSRRQAIRSSASAYEDINRTLGNFYETPEDDPEKEELRERIEELEAMMAQQAEPSGTSLDDQVALLEKSYELAAKYMPAGQGGTSQTPPAQTKEEPQTTRNGKVLAMPVKQVTTEVVSALAQPMTNAEFAAAHVAERNYGFHTAIGNAAAADKNTISACVHADQTITDGQAVRLRLLEPMEVSRTRIPRNTIVVGAARVQGERLGVEITSLEYKGTIIPVELSVFDSDGQEGIFIPNSMEVSAVKEVAANMGSSLGSSINISTDAGAQLASDLGKGVIQGASQYISKKMRTVKVHLKAGYKVMLYQPEN